MKTNTHIVEGEEKNNNSSKIMEKGRDENRVDMIYQLMITAVLKALQEHLFKKTVF